MAKSRIPASLNKLIPYCLIDIFKLAGDRFLPQPTNKLIHLLSLRLLHLPKLMSFEWNVQLRCEIIIQQRRTLSERLDIRTGQYAPFATKYRLNERFHNFQRTARVFGSSFGLKGERLATSRRGTNVAAGEACELEVVLELVPLSITFLTKC